MIVCPINAGSGKDPNPQRGIITRKRYLRILKGFGESCGKQKTQTPHMMV